MTETHKWIEQHKTICGRLYLWISLRTDEGDIDYLPIDTTTCPKKELEKVKAIVKAAILDRSITNQ